ncbi:MAG: oxidoreductase [Ignavibacteriaceae bacterium]|nr:MAG: aldo/keto reductase [Chlorobiota bacterium]GJQ32948.1 MAG: oxidoreductase [Ignavibacteriaceae bacterium]
MRSCRVGKSDLEISEISLGCWTLGGLNWVDGTPNGWANVDENEVAEAINYAIDHGVTHFDNADVYGNGRAERMLAKILGERTNKVTIATKIGWFRGTAAHAYEPAHIRHQCEQSLINLRRDFIDLYYFHHGDFGQDDVYLDDAIEVMYRLKEEGKIRVIGQSAYSHERFATLGPKVKPEAFQSSASALDDNKLVPGTPTADTMKEHNISFVAFGPVAQGLLLGKYSKDNPPKFEPGDHRANAPRFSPENLAKLEPKIEALKKQFGPTGEDLSRVALQYLLKYDSVAAVIPGFRNLAQVKMNLQAADKPLTDDEFNFVKSVFSE